METVKLRRGPQPGIMQIKKHAEQVMISAPAYPDMSVFDPEYRLDYSMKYGHYQRTNMRTKKGHAIFEWMGWRGEVVG